jgi:hypothetical protein
VLVAGLSDMEELLSRIQNKAITDYMREALGCYGAGAYRACVVLSYIAVFDDLRQKLAQLASVSSIAKEISKEVEQRADGQQIYESYMIDQLRAAGLITEVEAFRLDQIRALRNKAAHPSGLHPSPEEARYVYFETIDKFLSRQVLKTTHGVDSILTRLKNDNYFPSATVDDVAAIVASEMSAIHPLAISYLVIKLVDSNDSTEEILSSNAARFLTGLAVANDPSINQELRKRLLIAKADDSAKRKLLMTVLAVNPVLLLALDGTTFLRLRNIMESAIVDETITSAAKVSHPAVLLGKLVDKLGAEYVETNLAKFSEAAVTAFCYWGSLVQAAKKSAALRNLLVSVWKEKAGSGDFATANSFAVAAAQIDTLFDLLEPAEALDIVLDVCKAAKWGAFSSIDLRDQKFATTPVLADRAKEYVKENPTDADQKVQKAFSISVGEFVERYLQSSSPES